MQSALFLEQSEVCVTKTSFSALIHDTLHPVEKFLVIFSPRSKLLADISWRDKVHGNKNSKMRTIGQKFMSLLRQVATGFDFCSGKIPLWESGVRKIISCERKINYTFSKYCFIFVNKLSHTATVNKIKTLKAGHRESNRYFFLSVFLCSTVQLMFVGTTILNVLSS